MFWRRPVFFTGLLLLFNQVSCSNYHGVIAITKFKWSRVIYFQAVPQCSLVFLKGLSVLCLQLNALRLLLQKHFRFS